MHLGFGELILIFIVILLIFGSSKLPALGDALGRGIKNFKKGLNNAVKDNDENFPRDWRLSYRARESKD